MKLFGGRGNPTRKWKSRSRLIDLHKTSVSVITRPEMAETAEPLLLDEQSLLYQTATPPAQETISVPASVVCDPHIETPPVPITVPTLAPHVSNPHVKTSIALSSSEKFALMYNAFFSNQNAPLVQYQNPNGWRS